jgi:hypothetical protein
LLGFNLSIPEAPRWQPGYLREVLSAQLKISDIDAASFAAAQSMMNAHLVVVVFVFDNSPVDPNGHFTDIDQFTSINSTSYSMISRYDSLAEFPLGYSSPA